MLAEILIGFIFQFGSPKEIRYRDIILKQVKSRYVMCVKLSSTDKKIAGLVR